MAAIEQERENKLQKDLKEMQVTQPKIKRPPMGIQPAWLMWENRLKDIREAILRYTATLDYAIPVEWITEYNELLEKYKNRHNQ